MMGLNGLHLDNFAKSQQIEITKKSAGSRNSCSFIDTTHTTFPVTESSLIENFGLENEIEVETDLLPTIEFTSGYFNNLTNLQCLFLNVYSTYSCIVIKVEFLDIFSPPPNC